MSSIDLMRWVARCLSIPWAFWALFLTFFVVGNYHSEDKYFGLAVMIIIIIIALLLFLGAAITASLWRKEAFGGVLLLVDSVLIIVAGALAPHSPPISHLALPPFVAGSLFLICSWRS